MITVELTAGALDPRSPTSEQAANALSPLICVPPTEWCHVQRADGERSCVVRDQVKVDRSSSVKDGRERRRDSPFRLISRLFPAISCPTSFAMLRSSTCA